MVLRCHYVLCKYCVKDGNEFHCGRETMDVLSTLATRYGQTELGCFEEKYPPEEVKDQDQPEKK
jgi:hypothetical protein